MPGGVVSDPELRAGAVLGVARRAAELGWHTVDVTASPLPGPSGNVEYFLRLRATTDRPLVGDALTDAVRVPSRRVRSDHRAHRPAGRPHRP